MEEAPENGKESSHSAHASRMDEWMNERMNGFMKNMSIIWTENYKIMK